MKVIIFGINSMIPDPIPIVDEVLMLVPIINDIVMICRGMVIVEWIREHKVLLKRIAIGIILFIVASVLLRRFLPELYLIMRSK